MTIHRRGFLGLVAGAMLGASYVFPDLGGETELQEDHSFMDDLVEVPIGSYSDYKWFDETDRRLTLEQSGDYEATVGRNGTVGQRGDPITTSDLMMVL